MFSIKDKVIVVTGAGGVLCAGITKYLSDQGAKVIHLDRNEKAFVEPEAEAKKEGKEFEYYVCDVLKPESLEAVNEKILAKHGRIDILINGAGGNMPGAVIAPDQSFFNLDINAWKSVLELNLAGTLIPTLVFGKIFEKQKHGIVLNFSSMSAPSAITRVLGYSNAKAGVDNFTKWLAVEFGKKIGAGVRVNAVAPGFFITHQNRALLTNPDGSYTERGNDVIKKTPFGKFGVPSDLYGAIHFLISDASSFMTGVVLPVDGGFSCYSGV